MAISTNLYIDQGSDYSVTLNITNNDGTLKNLSGYTARAQLRRSYTSKSNTAFTANVTAPAEGEITLTLPAATSSAMRYGRYVFDVETVSNTSSVARVLEGIAVLNPEVTR